MIAGQPQAVLREVPNVGHAPMLDEPAAMRALEDFLAIAP
jgi:pimeloyl-ACP methyl ester carboxylesterase